MNCRSCEALVDPTATACLHCGASVVQQDSTGKTATCAIHPTETAQIVCRRCGSFACTQCVGSSMPGKELCQSCEAREPRSLLPWDQREEIGLFRAFWQTCARLLTAPNDTFSTLRPDGTVGSSLLFAGIATLAGMLTTLLLYAVILGGIFFAVGPGPLGIPFDNLGTPLALLLGALVFLLYLGFLVGTSIVWLLASTGLDHLVLKAVGANPKPYSVTLRASSLSMAPYLIGVIPVCGLYVFPVWGLVLKVFAFKHLHKTTGGKAAAGALMVSCGAFLLFLGVYGAILFVALSSASP